MAAKRKVKVKEDNPRWKGDGFDQVRFDRAEIKRQDRRDRNKRLTGK
jgi:hypothetical protein